MGWFRSLWSRMRARYDKRVQVLILFLGLIFLVDFGLTLQGLDKRYWRYFSSKCPAQTSLDEYGSIIPERCVSEYLEKRKQEGKTTLSIFDPVIDSTGVYPNDIREKNPIGVWALARGPVVFGGLFVFYLLIVWAIMWMAKTHLVRLLTFFWVVAGHLVGTTSWIGSNNGIGGYFFRNVPNDSMISKDVLYFGADVLYYAIIAYLLGKVMCSYIPSLKQESGQNG